jgi:hypothetical protein
LQRVVAAAVFILTALAAPRAMAYECVPSAQMLAALINSGMMPFIELSERAGQKRTLFLNRATGEWWIVLHPEGGFMCREASGTSHFIIEEEAH